MNKLVDIEKSDGYFVIKIVNGEQVQINVKDMQENSPILLAVADNNTPFMKEITIPGTGFSFVLVEKNMNLVFKQKSLLDTKLSAQSNLSNNGNPIFKSETIIDSGLNYLFIYFPEEKYVNGTISNELFSFAKKSKNHQDYFHQKIYEKYVNIFNKYVIRKLISQNELFVICCVPSHDECNEINNVMSSVIKSVKTKYYSNYFVDGSNVLYRKYITEKLSLNTGVRSMENQYNSLAIRNSDLINNRTILLIDDFYTTGSTINACKKILLENGAKKVILFTFGKTRQVK